MAAALEGLVRQDPALEDIRASIRRLPAQQQPIYPDQAHLERVETQLGQRPPLVSPESSERLLDELGGAVTGEAFLLQGGPCAETFEDKPESTARLVNVLLGMAVVLAYHTGRRIIKVPRIAGQFPKPRSSGTETRDGITLNAYRGDSINGFEFTEEARVADPERLLQAYGHSRGTLDLINDQARAGSADLDKIHDWNVDFAHTRSSEEVRDRYKSTTDGITAAMRFMKACGVAIPELSSLHRAELYTSHEALLLPYELPLLRRNEAGEVYDSSGNLLWVGERTRQLDGAHIALARAIRNPVGVKIGPTTTPDQVLGICEAINPEHRPGRLTLITRMGVNKVEKNLPPLLEAVERSGYPVVWSCDPVHGNTLTDQTTGLKTREVGAVIGEVRGFFAALRRAGVSPGGLHVEITGDNVTECLGGSEPTRVTDLSKSYTTQCDPRLNPPQAIELAFEAAQELAKS
jgi:3-deoxy-7-phosphoheptulonate synthase